MMHLSSEFHQSYAPMIYLRNLQNDYSVLSSEYLKAADFKIIKIFFIVNSNKPTVSRNIIIINMNTSFVSSFLLVYNLIC